MRIALDCRAAFQGMGGIGRYTWSLLQEYARNDTENEYVCYFTHLDPPGALDLPPRFTVRRMQSGMIDERFDQLVLPTLLKQDRIELYHNPIFAVPMIKSGARCVATVHDVVFKRHPEMVESRLAQYLDKATTRAAKYADLIVTVSEYSKKEISSLYGVGADRIRVIPNGMSLPGQGGSLPPGTSLDALSLKAGAYLLYVGSLEPKKNIQGILRSFELLIQEGGHPDLKLALVGSAVAKDYPVKEWAQTPALRGRVVVPGYVSEELLELLYRSALIFVYLSFYEGFGIPPLEAMARGIPTVVSDTSSLPEVVGADGVCVNPHRPDLAAQAIEELLSNDSRRKELSERGRRRALAFTWERSALRHLESYQSLSPNRHETSSSRI